MKSTHRAKAFFVLFIAVLVAAAPFGCSGPDSSSSDAPPKGNMPEIKEADQKMMEDRNKMSGRGK
jgi:hypothetical protein